MAHYGDLPPGVTLSIAPFRADVSEERLQHLKALLELSPVAPAVFENSTTGKNFRISRDWLLQAKNVWTETFNWRQQEDRINSFPNFKASVEDREGNTLDIQFLALFSKKVDATPIAFFHGWPGSICEFLDILDVLKRRYSPTSLPYHIVVPSLPGYAYSSGPPIDKDYSIDLAADAMNSLMVGLGFGSGYLAQGGDLGSFVSRSLALNHDACKGMHVNMMTIPPSVSLQNLPSMDEQERKVSLSFSEFVESGSAFQLEQATRPATPGFALSASPLSLLGWIGEKFLEWSDEDPPLEAILRSVTLYWLTDTLPRCLYHSRTLIDRSTLNAPYIEKPSGYSLFAHEVLPIPKSWAALSCNLIYYNQHDRGGHFAAMERPQELIDDIEGYIERVLSMFSMVGSSHQ